jgi:hypothetical protein
MKQTNYAKTPGKKARLRTHQIIARLDESLPLETEEWQPVEKLLSQLCEFAPMSMVSELASAIASFADDQARRGYILGQEDMVEELQNRVA